MILKLENELKVKKIKVEINFHENQKKIFDPGARYKIIAKGRRFGLTKGMVM